MIDYAALSDTFVLNDWKWKDKEGNYFIPTVNDVELAIEKMVETLNTSGENEVQLTMGRMIMQKKDDHFDLYLYSGSYAEEN